MNYYRRRLIMFKKSGSNIDEIPSIESTIGDVCVYNAPNDKLSIVNDWSADKYPIDTYVPIGLVVVPGSHNVYGMELVA